MHFKSLTSFIKYRKPNLQLNYSSASDRNVQMNKSTEKHFDVVIIGGGILGVTTARELILKKPHLKIALLEKESNLAMHQTGHNSGVIHAGIYYKVGSMRALFCSAGLRAIYKFCDENSIPYKKCGKLIVALNETEVTTLEYLYRQAVANDVPDVQLLDADGIRQVEPYCRGIKAVYSPHTGIVDYGLITKHCADEFVSKGGTIRYNFKVVNLQDLTIYVQDKIADYPVEIIGENEGQVILAKNVVACAGLYSDTIARMTFAEPDPQIIPFRGEYLMLSKEKQHLVKGNIYPVPDPRFPFLGVHFTPRLDGSVLIGPNALLAFAREGYRLTDFNSKEFLKTILHPGFRILAGKYLSYGYNEFLNSLFIKRNIAQLQKYIPDITVNDITRGPTGVRAQAVDISGNLVEGFELECGASGYESRVMHVRNAPSPSATSCFPISRYIYSKMEEVFKI